MSLLPTLLDNWVLRKTTVFIKIKTVCPFKDVAEIWTTNSPLAPATPGYQFPPELSSLTRSILLAAYSNILTNLNKSLSVSWEAQLEYHCSTRCKTKSSRPRQAVYRILLMHEVIIKAHTFGQRALKCEAFVLFVHLRGQCRLYSQVCSPFLFNERLDKRQRPPLLSSRETRSLPRVTEPSLISSPCRGVLSVISLVETAS